MDYYGPTWKANTLRHAVLGKYTYCGIDTGGAAITANPPPPITCKRCIAALARRAKAEGFNRQRQVAIGELRVASVSSAQIRADPDRRLDAAHYVALQREDAP